LSRGCQPREDGWGDSAIQREVASPEVVEFELAGLGVVITT